MAYQGPETKIVDLGGRMVMPGIHDLHTHFIMAAEETEYGCRFSEIASIETGYNPFRKPVENLSYNYGNYISITALPPEVLKRKLR